MTNSHRLTAAAIRAVAGDREKMSREFNNIPVNKVNISTMPRFTECKNRYMNILPNNHSR